MTAQSSQKNPLLEFHDLPPFDAILASDVSPAITALLARCRSVVQQVESDPDQASWDNIVIPLDDVTEQLGRVWDLVSHLHSVCDTPALRAAYNENQPQITEFYTSLGQNLQ